MGVFALIVLGFIVLVVLIGLSSAIRIINEYERGVLFRLGRLMPERGPGIIFIIPILERWMRVDLRVTKRSGDARFQLLRDVVFEPFGFLVNFVPGVAKRLYEIQLDQPVMATSCTRRIQSAMRLSRRTNISTRPGRRGKRRITSRRHSRERRRRS